MHCEKALAIVIHCGFPVDEVYIYSFVLLIILLVCMLHAVDCSILLGQSFNQVNGY